MSQDKLRKVRPLDEADFIDRPKTPASSSSRGLWLAIGGVVVTMGVVLLAVVVLAVLAHRRRASDDALKRAVENLGRVNLAVAESLGGYGAPMAIARPDGTPLLSWRVMILPRLGRSDLFARFHLDEPWDSPANLPLLDEMPDVFRPQNGGVPGGHSTFLQVVTGPNTLYRRVRVSAATHYAEPPMGRILQYNGVFGATRADITDGSFNTLLVVEGKTAVPWTKPDDVALPGDQLGPELGGEGFPAGVVVGFADGTRGVMKRSVAPNVLGMLIAPADGVDIRREQVAEFTPDARPLVREPGASTPPVSTWKAPWHPAPPLPAPGPGSMAVPPMKGMAGPAMALPGQPANKQGMSSDEPPRVTFGMAPAGMQPFVRPTFGADLLDVSGELTPGRPGGVGAARDIRPPRARLGDVTVGREPREAGEVGQLRGITGAVQQAAVSPDGRGVLAGADDAVAHLWDVESRKEVGRLVGHRERVMSVAFSPDGRRAVTGGQDGTARIWELETGKELHRLVGHGDWVLGVAFTPDGRRVVTCSGGHYGRGWETGRDQTARVWDAATGQELARLPGHTGLIYTVAVSPDGQKLVTASADATARVWDLVTGKTLVTLDGHAGPVQGVAFSPDGRRVVTASVDKTARVWDAATGKVLRVYRGHEGEVAHAVFSPEGRRVVSSSWVDGTLQVWDPVDGRALGRLAVERDHPNRGQVTPDGRLAVWAWQNSVVRLFALPEPAPPGAPDRPARPPVVRRLPAPLRDVAVGGAGRYLLLPLKGSGRVAVFDANAADVVRTIDFPAADVRVAAGADLMVVALPGQRLIERWSLTTWTREARAPWPAHDTPPAYGSYRAVIDGLALGPDSRGPVLACWRVVQVTPAGIDAVPAGALFSLIDPATLKVLRVPAFEGAGNAGPTVPPGPSAGFSPSALIFTPVEMRGSGDGRLFTLFNKATGQFYAVALRGREVRLTAEARQMRYLGMVGSTGRNALAPSPDGRVVYSQQAGVVDPDGRLIDRLANGRLPDEALIPAAEPSYYLGLNWPPGRHPHDAPMATMSGYGSTPTNRPKRRVVVAVHAADSGQVLLTLKGLDELDELSEDDPLLDRRVRFIPAADLLVTIPPGNDRLVLRRLNVPEALKSLGADYLFVTSPRLVVVAPGRPFRHQLVVRSSRGDVNCKVLTAPPGVSVTRDGLVSWDVPTNFQPPQSVVVKLADGSGREYVHGISLTSDR